MFSGGFILCLQSVHLYVAAYACMRRLRQPGGLSPPEGSVRTILVGCFRGCDMKCFTLATSTANCYFCNTAAAFSILSTALHIGPLHCHISDLNTVM